MRTACYIDGFNLYHAVEKLREPALKWCDLYSLSVSYLRPGDTLEKVTFFTALNTWNAPKRKRHVNYVNALEHFGVNVIHSKFDTPPKWCHRHERYCKIREEKQTDVAFSIEVLSDCYELGIERVLLITADSDHVPMVARVRARFPAVIVYLIAPPGRLKVARELGQNCSGIAELRAGRLRQHSLPLDVRNEAGRLVAARPSIYGPRFE